MLDYKMKDMIDLFVIIHPELIIKENVSSYEMAQVCGPYCWGCCDFLHDTIYMKKNKTSAPATYYHEVGHYILHNFYGDSFRDAMEGCEAITDMLSWAETICECSSPVTFLGTLEQEYNLDKYSLVPFADFLVGVYGKKLPGYGAHDPEYYQFKYQYADELFANLCERIGVDDTKGLEVFKESSPDAWDWFENIMYMVFLNVLSKVGTDGLSLINL